MRVVVIGAGHNGLAAAFHLAAAGLQPLVFEARSEIGGGAITTEIHPGFRCPTLTHEVLLHERIARDMRLARRGLEFVRPQVDRCALRLDGAPAVLYQDVARTATDLANQSPRDVEPFLTFAATLRHNARVIASLAGAPPPRTEGMGARDALTWVMAARRFRALPARDAHQLLRWISMPIADVVRDAVDDSLLQATIAGPALVGTKLGPGSAGTTLLMLIREAHRQLAGGGVRIPIGGPGAVTGAMAAAAREAGARIDVDAPVEQILVDGGRVRGVVVRGREQAADVVLSGIDPKTTWWLAGMPETDPAMNHRIRHYRVTGTLAKINLALAALPSFAGIGTDRTLLDGRLQIGPSLDYLERACDCAKYGEISPEPWLDVAIPSILDPDLAPPGAHVVSIYAHCVPRDLRSGDWAAAADAILRTVMGTLEQYAPGVSALVVGAQVITPRVLQRDYGFAGGHVFHGEMALDQLFAMRPVFGCGRYRTPVRGLYMCSAGTHPGGFMTPPAAASRQPS